MCWSVTACNKNTVCMHEPNSEHLPVRGLFIGKLKHGDTEVMDEVYVVPAWSTSSVVRMASNRIPWISEASEYTVRNTLTLNKLCSSTQNLLRDWESLKGTIQ